MEALVALWRLGQLPAGALERVSLTGADPVLPSSFCVGTAAQASIAAAALAATEFGTLRGQPEQGVAVDMAHAVAECSGWFSIDGRVPEAWDKFSGLYRCVDGWVRIHTNFAHHRVGALKLLGLDQETAQRADVQQALLGWKAVEFEQAAAENGMVVAAARSFDSWDTHPQGRTIAGQALLSFERIGDAPARRWAGLAPTDLPLRGVRVLDLTRILAGPVGGRTLAAYGADVMLVNAPHLPNIESIADTSRGKLSALLDLCGAPGQAGLDALLATGHVFIQGYRPGAMDALGFGVAAIAARHPGIVCVSLSAYGDAGPWGERRGFDSLVQTATGFNLAEAQAAGAAEPRAMPAPILDYATGFLMAFATSAALRRQAREGGSWHVRVSLARTALWLRQLGRLADGFSVGKLDRRRYVETTASGFGRLAAVRHSAQLSRTPPAWARPSVPPGTHPPQWP